MNIPQDYIVNKSHSISDSIAFCYAVNENSGTTLTDISGNGYNCQLMNNPTWISNGVLKFAGFQGTTYNPLPSQYGTIPSYNKIISSATFIVIATIDDLTYDYPGLIFSRNIQHINELEVTGLNIRAGRVYGPASTGYHWNNEQSTWSKAGPPLYVGIKYMIAVSVSSNLATLYAYDYSTNQMASVNNIFTHIPVLLNFVEIMRDSVTDEPNRYFNGKLEFAAMWERALSSSELIQIAQNPSVFLQSSIPDLVTNFTIQEM